MTTTFFKKGSFGADTAIVIFFALLLAVGGIIGYVVVDNINDEIQADATLNDTTKGAMQEIKDDYAPFFDGLFITVFIFLWIGVLIASFLLDTHWIFLAIAIVLMVFFLIVAAFFSNFYDEFVNSSAIAGISSNFPIMNFVMNNLLLFGIVMAVTVAIAIFAKNRSQ